MKSSNAKADIRFPPAITGSFRTVTYRVPGLRSKYGGVPLTIFTSMFHKFKLVRN